MNTRELDEHKESHFKNVDREIEFVAGISKSKEILSAANDGFNENWITNDRVRKIYNLIIQYYMEENVIMDYIGYAKIRDSEDTERTLLLNTWQKIEYAKKDCTLSTTIGVKKTLQNLYNLRCIQSLTKFNITKLKVAAQTQNYSTDEIIRKLGELDIQLAQDTGSEAVEMSNSYGDFKKRHQLMAADPSRFSGVMTGIQCIDNPMGGLRDGEFGIILGPTASGKSIILMNFAIHCWMHYGDAVIVTIEMSKDDYLDRMYSLLSHIKFSRFRHAALNKHEWRYLDNMIKMIEKHEHKLHIVDMRKGCNMLSLKANLDKIIQKRPVRGIFIDYLNIMAQPDEKVSVDWQQQVALAISMKQSIARELHKPTWTLGQTTNDNNGAAFSSHIQDQVDIALKLHPDNVTPDTGLLPAQFIKTRNFKAEKIVLETAYQYMSAKPLNHKKLKITSKLEEYDGKLGTDKP